MTGATARSEEGSMTKFGKFLVFLNLGLSLGLMIWALSLYVNRIDWSDNPAKEGQPAGQLVKRKADGAAPWDPMLTSERDWRGARQDLLDPEARRRDRRRWDDADRASLAHAAKPAHPTQLN